MSMIILNTVSIIISHLSTPTFLKTLTIEIIPKTIDVIIKAIRKRPNIPRPPTLKFGNHFIENSKVYILDVIKDATRKYTAVNKTANFENLFIFFISLNFNTN